MNNAMIIYFANQLVETMCRQEHSKKADSWQLGTSLLLGSLSLILFPFTVAIPTQPTNEKSKKMLML